MNDHNRLQLPDVQRQELCRCPEGTQQLQIEFIRPDDATAAGAPSAGTPVVYCIRNKRDGKVYVGFTRNFARRRTWHRGHLRRGKHRNHRLQNAWDRDGEGNFAFEVLEIVSASDRPAEREKLYIDSLEAADPEHGYNIRSAIDSRLDHYVCTPETREKLSALGKGRPKTREHRARLSEGVRRHAAESRQPPRPCRNCKKSSERPLTHELCAACYMYEREHEGNPRPPEHYNKPTRRRKSNQQCCNCPAVCVQLTRGRCPGCYQYFLKYREERPQEMCVPLPELA